MNSPSLKIFWTQRVPFLPPKVTPQGRPRRPCAEAGHFCTIRLEVVLQWCNTSGSESMPRLSGAMPQVMASHLAQKKITVRPGTQSSWLVSHSFHFLLAILIYQCIFLMGFWKLVRICKNSPLLWKPPMGVTVQGPLVGVVFRTIDHGRGMGLSSRSFP